MKNNTPQENTQRLINYARSKGYKIIEINPDKTWRPITLKPAGNDDFTPEICWDSEQGMWLIQTSSFGY